MAYKNEGNAILKKWAQNKVAFLDERVRND